MKLINQSAQYLPQQAGINGIYKQIELAGRTSYLSWDKMVDIVSVDLNTLPKNITVDDIPDYKLHPKECVKFLNDNKISYHFVDSSKKFVDMLIKSKHTSVLEHGTVYLYIEYIEKEYWAYHIQDYVENPYSKVHIDREGIDDSDLHFGYVTTNLRVLQENGWLDDLKYLCEPTEFHEKRLSVKVITDIGVTREFNRHRTFSIVEQSTRYCNFSRDRFGNEVTYIIPFWSDIPEGTYTTLAQVTPGVRGTKNRLLFNQLTMAQDAYITLIEEQCTPQEARAVLPLCTKTEVVYTAFESDWRHFFDLRLFGKTGDPHPQMKQLAELIKEEFEKAGVWEGIMKYQSKYE